MRLLADMGISVKAVVALRALGHDAVHLRELGLQRLSDEEILAKAAAEGRVVLVHDLDMSRIMALGGASKPSIVTFRLQNMSAPELLPFILQAIEVCRTELDVGSLVTVNGRTIRSRKLPVRR